MSVIVCTKDRPEHLRLVLEGLAAQEVRPGEVVVSDSGSSVKGLVEDVAARFALDVTYVHRPTGRFNSAATRNAGALASTGSRLLFLDGDCVPLPRVVSLHAQHARDPRDVLVGGYVRMDRERSDRLLAGGLAGMRLASLISDEQLAALRWRHRKNRWYSLIRHPKRPAVHGGHFSVSSALFRAVNGFDESFWRHEDDDLSCRLIRGGGRPQSLWGGAVCLHVWHPSDPGALIASPVDAGTPAPDVRRPVRCRLGFAEAASRVARQWGDAVGSPPGKRGERP